MGPGDGAGVRGAHRRPRSASSSSPQAHSRPGRLSRLFAQRRLCDSSRGSRAGPPSLGRSGRGSALVAVGARPVLRPLRGLSGAGSLALRGPRLSLSVPRLGLGHPLTMRLPPRHPSPSVGPARMGPQLRGSFHAPPVCVGARLGLGPPRSRAGAGRGGEASEGTCYSGAGQWRRLVEASPSLRAQAEGAPASRRKARGRRPRRVHSEAPEGPRGS